MSASDLAVQILKEIRDELRESRMEHESSREEATLRFVASNQRIEVIEASLRDLVQQMVMLGRGIRVLLEGRGSDSWIEALELRVGALESKLS